MAVIEAAALIKVGYPAIDSDHQEFVDLLNRLDEASNAEFPVMFKQLFEHTEQHFAMENQLMLDYAFPAETEHKGEHLRLLSEFKEFQSRVEKGMISFGRAFVKERLAQWFLLHITTMDSALAAYVKAVGNDGR